MSLWNAHERFFIAAAAIGADLSRLLMRRAHVIREHLGVDVPASCRYQQLKTFAYFSFLDAAVLVGQSNMAREVLACNVNTLVLHLCDVTCKFTETGDDLGYARLILAFGGRFDVSSIPLADPVTRVAALLGAVRKEIGQCCGVRMMHCLLSAIGLHDLTQTHNVIRLITYFTSPVPVNVWELYYDLTTQCASQSARRGCPSGGL